MNDEYERKDDIETPAEEQDTTNFGSKNEHYENVSYGSQDPHSNAQEEYGNVNSEPEHFAETNNQETYDQGYYVESNKKEEKQKSNIGFKFVSLALIFSLIGSLVGGAFGVMLVKREYDGKVISEVTGKPEGYTINTNDNINTVAAVAKSTLDSVVGISTTSIMKDFFNRQYESQGTGSGVIVDSRGYILTNNHVISSLSQGGNYFGNTPDTGYANDIQVVFNDGSQLAADVVWADSDMDLAILKVESDKTLPAAKLGNSDELVIGEMAIAIGNPFAIEFHGTVTAGYISGLNRNLSASGALEMDNLIQTDASINEGNSGGPLLNSRGEVIGINTMKISAGEGMGFSIPINTAKPVIEKVIATGSFERVALGVSGIDVKSYESRMGTDLGVDEGIIVINIYDGSAAKEANLKTNDIIISVDDVTVDTIASLRRALTKYSIGDKAMVKYLRDGDSHTVEVTFKEFNTSN